MDPYHPGGSAPRASGSRTSNTGAEAGMAAGVPSFENDADMPPIQKRPRRTHARRSCQMCQRRKARCELPDLEVPSSPLPLPDHQACHRCKTLQISCIVDDANKKVKKAASNDTPSRPTQAKRQESSTIDRPRMQKSSTNASLSSIGDRRSVSSTASSSATSLLPSGAANADADSLKFAGGRELGNQIVYPSEPRLVSKTPDSSSDEGTPPPSGPSVHQPNAQPGYIKTQDRSPRDAADIDTWERFSTRSRPLTLLTELVPRQNGFASKVFRLVSARATIETDVTEIISNEKSKMLSDWCEENLTIWMPHVSNAYQIRQEALQGKQTLSTQLLEQVLYLIAMQHIRDPQDDVLRFSVARFIIRDSARLMLTSPRSSKAVEALELLALFPVDVSVIPGPSRNRIRTDSLISAAERFARSVRLDRVALTAAAPYSFFSSSNQLDDFETKRTAMEWASVKTWYTCFTIGDDELYESVDERFFSDDWSRSLVLPTDFGRAENDSDIPGSTENEMFAKKKWSRSRRLGSTGLAMRCLAMKQLLVAFSAIRNTPVDLSETDRLSSISAILDRYKRQVEEVDDEFRQRLADSTNDSQLLRTWLRIETTAGYLLVLGAGILRGLGIDKKESVPAHELALLIRGENASPEMRGFLTQYGEHRILAAEKVLVNVSIISRDAKTGKAATLSDRSSRRSDSQNRSWMVEGRSRTVVPVMNLCGYALEAAFNAMEMHATMFKLWKTPPKRSESWQLVFSNVVNAMLSLDPDGSIQNGSIPATCAYILQGMLKVIICWTDCSRKKDIQRTISTPTANTNRRETRETARFGSNRDERPSARFAMGARPDAARYMALVQDGVETSRNFNAAQTSDAHTGSPQTNFGRGRGEQGGPHSYSRTASLLETGMPSTQYSNVRSEHRTQAFAPDPTESLAAALPPSGDLNQGHTHSPLQQNFYGQSRGGPAASVPSNLPMHTHTPPFYQNGGNSVAMMNTSSNASSLSLVDANSNNNGDINPSVALDSLDFILNDVLGSSEWSGILQDIWRTDI